MSFPIYLTHLLVICTLGSSVFIAIKPHAPHAVSVGLTLATVFLATITVSYPLARFDVAWVRSSMKPWEDCEMKLALSPAMTCAMGRKTLVPARTCGLNAETGSPTRRESPPV